MTEGERRVQPSSFSQHHILGQRFGKPVVLQKATHEEPPCTTWAGFPATEAPAGTSDVTTAPAPIRAPQPMRTPLRIIAPMPIQTSSSMITGLVLYAGRKRRSPNGALAI